MYLDLRSKNGEIAGYMLDKKNVFSLSLMMPRKYENSIIDIMVGKIKGYHSIEPFIIASDEEININNKRIHISLTMKKEEIVEDYLIIIMKIDGNSIILGSNRMLDNLTKREPFFLSKELFFNRIYLKKDMNVNKNIESETIYKKNEIKEEQELFDIAITKDNAIKSSNNDNCIEEEKFIENKEELILDYTIESSIENNKEHTISKINAVSDIKDSSMNYCSMNSDELLSNELGIEDVIRDSIIVTINEILLNSDKESTSSILNDVEMTFYKISKLELENNERFAILKNIIKELKVKLVEDFFIVGTSKEAGENNKMLLLMIPIKNNLDKNIKNKCRGNQNINYIPSNVNNKLQYIIYSY